MEKIILQHGEKCSKNFVLDKKITSLDELMDVLNTSPSLFVRHRPYPSAFIRSWQFHMIKNWLDRGDFWTIKSRKDFEEKKVILTYADGGFVPNFTSPNPKILIVPNPRFSIGKYIVFHSEDMGKFIQSIKNFIKK